PKIRRQRLPPQGFRRIRPHQSRSRRSRRQILLQPRRKQSFARRLRPQAQAQRRRRRLRPPHPARTRNPPTRRRGQIQQRRSQPPESQRLHHRNSSLPHHGKTQS